MTTTAAVKEKPRRLTPRQWAEAEALWESGETTLKDLATRFKVSEQAMHIHMKRAGIVRGSKAAAHKKKVAEEVTKASVTDATIVAARIRETKEEHYRMSSGIAKLAWSEILKAKQEGHPVAAAMNNLKALDVAMTVIVKARTERWAVLGLDREDYVDEDGLPELLVSELTAEQIEKLRSRDHLEMEDMSDDIIGSDEDESDNIVSEGE